MREQHGDPNGVESGYLPEMSRPGFNDTAHHSSTAAPGLAVMMFSQFLDD